MKRRPVSGFVFTPLALVPRVGEINLFSMNEDALQQRIVLIRALPTGGS